jgi:FMN phosphatase YigB (HAD superfamily)
MPVINAVLFDLFETLITEAKNAPTRAGSLAPVLGLERQAYRALWKARRPRIVVGDPEIYLRAVYRLGVRPEEALYVGDGGDHELAGAEAAGIRAARAAWLAPLSDTRGSQLTW